MRKSNFQLKLEFQIGSVSPTRFEEKNSKNLADFCPKTKEWLITQLREFSAYSEFRKKTKFEKKIRIFKWRDE